MSIIGDSSDHPRVLGPARPQPAPSRATLAQPAFLLQTVGSPSTGHRPTGSPCRLVYRVDAAASGVPPCGAVAGIEIRGLQPSRLLDLTVWLAEREVFALTSVTDNNGHVSTAGEILGAMAAYGRSTGDGLYVDLEGALSGPNLVDLLVCLSIRPTGDRPPADVALLIRMRQWLNVRNGLFAIGTLAPR